MEKKSYGRRNYEAVAEEQHYLLQENTSIRSLCTNGLRGLSAKFLKFSNIDPSVLKFGMLIQNAILQFFSYEYF